MKMVNLFISLFTFSFFCSLFFVCLFVFSRGSVTETSGKGITTYLA